MVTSLSISGVSLFLDLNFRNVEIQGDGQRSGILLIHDCITNIALTLIIVKDNHSFAPPLQRVERRETSKHVGTTIGSRT